MKTQGVNFQPSEGGQFSGAVDKLEPGEAWGSKLTARAGQLGSWRNRWSGRLNVSPI